MTPFPSIPKDLVEFLDTLYSARRMFPDKGETEREIWINVGKRELVETLIQARKDQETGADQGPPNVYLSDPSVGQSGSGGDAGPGSSPGGSFASPQDRLR